MSNTLTKLSYEILKIANREIPRSVFLKEISNLIRDWLECSELTLLLKIQKNESQFELINSTKNDFDFKIVNIEDISNHIDKEIGSLWDSILLNKFENSSSFFSEKGTFWTINFGNFAIPYRQKLGITTDIKKAKQSADYSLLIIPFLYSNNRVGLIQLKDIKREIFSSIGTTQLEEFAQTLSAILINQHTQSLLQERVKELAFLYELAKVTKQRDTSFEEIIYQIINLIPPAWQFPEITSVRITINGTEYASSNIGESIHVLTSDIIVDSEKIGEIEIIYTKNCPDISEGPFFKEERNLLNSIAAEIASLAGYKMIKNTHD